MSPFVSPTSADDETAALRATRRRIEAEILMYGSDRAKLQRRQDDIAVEKRMLKHTIDTKTQELEAKDLEAQKVSQDIQAVDVELARLKKKLSAV